MNGSVAKMLRKMKSNDKISKKAWKSLTPSQREQVSKVYHTDGPNKAVVAFGKALGNIT